MVFMGLINLCGLQVISAQQLPKINTDKPNSIVDPQVWVEIHGVSIDKGRAKTHRVDNNGTALVFPKWSVKYLPRGQMTGLYGGTTGSGK